MKTIVTPVWFTNTSWDNTTIKININYIIKWERITV